MSRYSLNRYAVIGRVLLATGGGYALAFVGSIGFAVVLCRVAGMDRADAFVSAAMISFLLWVIAAIVAFAARTTWRACAWILACVILLALIGWLGSPLPRPVA